MSALHPSANAEFRVLRFDNGPFYQQRAHALHTSEGLPEVSWFDYDHHYSNTIVKTDISRYAGKETAYHYYQKSQIPLRRRCFLQPRDDELFLQTQAVMEQPYAGYSIGTTTDQPNKIFKVGERVAAASLPYRLLVSFSIDTPGSFYNGKAESHVPGVHLIIAHGQSGQFIEVAYTAGHRSDVMPLFQLLTETFITKRREVIRYRPKDGTMQRRARWDDDDVI